MGAKAHLLARPVLWNVRAYRHRDLLYLLQYLWTRGHPKRPPMLILYRVLPSSPSAVGPHDRQHWTSISTEYYGTYSTTVLRTRDQGCNTRLGAALGAEIAYGPRRRSPSPPGGLD